MRGEWDLVSEVLVPDADQTLYLFRRGNLWSIFVDQYELMSSSEHGSEDALADLACDRLQVEAPRILVGGLGMGFTLAAALRRAGEGKVTVAELSEAVVQWNLEYTGRAAGHPLRDPRSSVYLGDICDLVEDSEACWDSILLDVDNGPRALTRQSNGWLYTREGLRRLRQALAPQGILGVWSSRADNAFTSRLRKAGFREVEAIEHVEPMRTTGDGSGRHFLWMARAVPG